MKLKVSLPARKVIGLQYVGMGGVFILIGYLSNFFAKTQLSPNSDAYRNIGELHGTMIVFFGIVPLLFAGLGYFLLSSNDGFNTWWEWLSWAGLSLYYLSGILVLIALFTAKSHFLILSMLANLAFVLICSGIFIITIVRDRLRRVGWLQMRCLVWTLLITALVLLPESLLLAFAATIQLLDYFVSGPSYSSPPVNASEMPRFWYHFFWFLGHPEVFVILLPILGLTMDGLRALLRKVRVAL